MLAHRAEAGLPLACLIPCPKASQRRGCLCKWDPHLLLPPVLIQVWGPWTGRLPDGWTSFPLVGLEEATVGTTHRLRSRDLFSPRKDMTAQSPLKARSPAPGPPGSEGLPSWERLACINPQTASHSTHCWSLEESPFFSQMASLFFTCFSDSCSHHVRVTLHEGQRSVCCPWSGFLHGLGSSGRYMCSPDL